jgi:hypothetical protein
MTTDQDKDIANSIPLGSDIGSRLNRDELDWLASWGARVAEKSRERTLERLRQRFRDEHLVGFLDLLDEPEVCGGALTSRAHDHRSDNTGLDDGPPLRDARMRRYPTKSPDEYRAIREKAWQTRRQKYGTQGHR